jgi:hypothetical protein
VTGYGLNDRGSGVRWGLGIPLFHRVQTDSRAHAASYPMATRGRGVKLTTHLHLVPRSKNAWRYTSTPQYVFMAWCLVKHKDFTFTFTRKTINAYMLLDKVIINCYITFYYHTALLNIVGCCLLNVRSKGIRTGHQRIYLFSNQFPTTVRLFIHELSSQCKQNKGTCLFALKGAKCYKATHERSSQAIHDTYCD